VDDAQARYDMTIAQELEARQNLGYTRRALQVIVNEPVESLADLVPARMELTPPFPTDVEEWITARKRSTPSCGRCAPTSNRPTRNSPRPVPATINRRPGRPAQHERERNNVSINSRYLTSQAGVQVNIPLFAGGYVSSQMRQARANIEDRAAVRSRRREISLQVRKEYQNITEGIAQDHRPAAGRALRRTGPRLQPEGLPGRHPQPRGHPQRPAAADQHQARPGPGPPHLHPGPRPPAGLVSSLNEKEIETINAWLDTPRS
jgi:outer membrane protein/protease secretion system outer membrane protein